MEEKIPLSILYLGRRGGGAKITKKIAEDLQTSNKFSLSSICIREDNEEVKEYDQSKAIKIFDALLSGTTLMKIFQYALVPTKLLSDMRLSTDGTCVVPMISPLGLVIEGLLKAQGVNIIRILHDFEKHPGDKWPPTYLIRRIIKQSKFLIALSDEVASKIKDSNPKIKVAIYPHPIFDFSADQIGLENRSDYILFIGRIRKYKGVENLVKAFREIDKKNIGLVIAGEGKLLATTDSSVRVINRWLDDNEIASLIKNAEVVVFPYIEASQSGFLPYCVSENKKVVVTPLSGLLEQTMSYRNTYITEDFGVEKLSLAISAAIAAETFIENLEVPKTVNFEKPLLESGLFSKR